MTTSTTAVIGSLVKEMEEQALITKEFLKLVPEDKYEWQPHPKSMSMIRLAKHVAELPGWASMAINTNELDFESGDYTEKPITNNTELMQYFDRSFEQGHTDLMNANEAVLDENWILRSGNVIHSKSTKGEVIRMAYNQIIHHRAQLGVYFRLLDIPVPQSFGPTADHTNF